MDEENQECVNTTNIIFSTETSTRVVSQPCNDGENGKKEID